MRKPVSIFLTVLIVIGGFVVSRLSPTQATANPTAIPNQATAVIQPDTCASASSVLWPGAAPYSSSPIPEAWRLSGDPIELLAGEVFVSIGENCYDEGQPIPGNDTWAWNGTRVYVVLSGELRVDVKNATIPASSIYVIYNQPNPSTPDLVPSFPASTSTPTGIYKSFELLPGDILIMRNLTADLTAVGGPASFFAVKVSDTSGESGCPPPVCFSGP